MDQGSLYTLFSADGLQAQFSTFGAALRTLFVPDHQGSLVNVVLGYSEEADYVQDTNFVAGVIGRYANRIYRGRLPIRGAEHRLAVNDGPHQLHGGRPGFHKVLWKVRSLDAHSIEFAYLSPAGEAGFPGNLDVSVHYTLAGQTLAVVYGATTDAETVVNLTNHPYFNLSGRGSILDHELSIRASRFTPVDESLIPTGELREVQGTPFDFRAPARIGDGLFRQDEQLRRGNGFDHNFVLDHSTGVLALAATLRDPASGRQMELWTTEPGLQLYTGNHLPGHPFPVHGGVCLEPQHFPDSPNHPEFPSTLLRPGEQYWSESQYRFSHAT